MTPLWRLRTLHRPETGGRAERPPASVAPFNVPPVIGAVPILGGRLVEIAPLRPEHAGQLAAALGADPEPFSLRGVPTSPDDLAAAVAAVCERSQPGRSAAVVLNRRSDGRAIGLVELWARGEAPARTVEIVDAWIAFAAGEGSLGFEVALHVFDLAFGRWQAGRVDVRLTTTNQRARHNLRLLGATFAAAVRAWMPADGAGELEDTVLYTLDAADWPELRRSLLTRVG